MADDSVHAHRLERGVFLRADLQRLQRAERVLATQAEELHLFSVK